MKNVAAEWTSRQHGPDRGAGDWLLDKPELPVDARTFLETLRRLGYVTREAAVYRNASRTRCTAA